MVPLFYYSMLLLYSMLIPILFSSSIHSLKLDVLLVFVIPVPEFDLHHFINRRLFLVHFSDLAINCQHCPSGLSSVGTCVGREKLESRGSLGRAEPRDIECVRIPFWIYYYVIIVT